MLSSNSKHGSIQAIVSVMIFSSIIVLQDVWVYIYVVIYEKATSLNSVSNTCTVLVKRCLTTGRELYKN